VAPVEWWKQILTLAICFRESLRCWIFVVALTYVGCWCLRIRRHVQGSLVWHTDLCLQAAHLSRFAAKRGRRHDPLSRARHTGPCLRAAHPYHLSALGLVDLLSAKQGLR
jgi:hypothetical protein